MTTHTLKIEFTADFICPFCYLGRRRLQIGMRIAELPVVYDITYRPFDIGKSLTKAGRNKKEWYLEKNGGNEEQNEKMIEVMKAMGKEVGIAFDYGGEVANTLDAHRLIMLVQTKKLGDVEKLVDSLCKQYFEEQKHPSSKATLLAASEAAGVKDLGAIERFLESDELEDEVKEAIVEANMSGYDGVPCISFEGRRRDFNLVGARSPLEYHNTIKQVLKELE